MSDQRQSTAPGRDQDRPNVVLLITDGHGFHTGDMDWGTEEYRNLKSRFDALDLEKEGWTEFENVMSPAASTIMAIESILSGLYAARAHKMHWREWPAWDRVDQPDLSSFLEARGYEVRGFSYLLNSENWMPGIRCYAPELYRDFPSHKRDTHSHHAVLSALRHYFDQAFTEGRPKFLIVHSIFLFDLWKEMMTLFRSHGITESNTVFAFTSDHYFPRNFGRQWLLGERDGALILHHTDLTEFNTRVFLYFRAPGLAPARVSQPVSGYDIAPTILDLLGVADEWPGRFDGKSLLPELSGRPGEARFLRADNVYPYQVGERQGRVTALKFGRYKYVAKPDPASSYVAYRLSESWGRAIEHEEFYDLEVDPLEAVNMVGDAEAEAAQALAACRRELSRTNGEILSAHADGLVRYCSTGPLAERLSAVASGRCMLVQSCPADLFSLLLLVLCRLVPASEVIAVVRDRAGWGLPDNCREVEYPEGRRYDPEGLRDVIGWDDASVPFELVLNTSGLPVGDFLSVFDPNEYPVGDYHDSCSALRDVPAKDRLTFALDGRMSPFPIARRGGGLRAPTSAALGSAVRGVVRWAKPLLRRAIRRIEGQGPRIADSLASRLIRRP